MERKPKTTKEMKGKAGRIKEKGKGKEVEPRAKRRKRERRQKKKRALKGIKEKTETIGKDGERRANRKEEKRKTTPSGEQTKNPLSPHSNGTKRRMNHYGGNEDGNGKASHQNRTEREKPPNNQRTKP